MNEDERGITPADVTAITVDRPGRNYRVIIERGNGDRIQMFELTEMERAQLAGMFAADPGSPASVVGVSFMDISR